MTVNAAAPCPVLCHRAAVPLTASNAIAHRILFLIIRHPHKPGSLPQSGRRLQPFRARRQPSRRFLVGAGSEMEGSQVLADAEARCLCGVVREASGGSGAGWSSESAPESMTWSGTGMAMGLGLVGS